MKTKTYLSNGAKILRHCRIGSIYFATFLREHPSSYNILHKMERQQRSSFLLFQSKITLLFLCLNFISIVEKDLNFVKLKVKSSEARKFSKEIRNKSLTNLLNDFYLYCRWIGGFELIFLTWIRFKHKGIL